jgi:putative ABC transport system ATP-binding protein
MADINGLYRSLLAADEAGDAAALAALAWQMYGQLRNVNQDSGRNVMNDARTASAPSARYAVPAVLELRGVSKVYGSGPAEVHALRQADLSVQAGSMVAVMGPSGSGKSTLLTIAGSLEDPTSGEVLVGGVPLAGMSRGAKARLRRRTIGYVFQDFNLLPGLTAAENVALPLELDGVPVRRARAAGLRALDGLGLAGRANRYPDQLSGGERQRVAIARAVAGERRLLLADEPSGALDSANGETVIGLIRAACRQGMAAVVVTHDAQLASLADRVVYLRDGQLADQTVPGGGPESLLEIGGNR